MGSQPSGVLAIRLFKACHSCTFSIEQSDQSVAMVIKDKEELAVWVLYVSVASSRAFLESESENIHEIENVLFDLVQDSAEQIIFFFERDKKTKQAAKALGQAAWNEFVGAADRRDQVRVRECIGKGAMDIARVALGEEAFTVIKERVSPYCKMWVNWEDAESEEMQFLMMAIGRGIRKELARRLIYTGPID